MRQKALILIATVAVVGAVLWWYLDSELHAVLPEPVTQTPAAIPPPPIDSQPRAKALVVAAPQPVKPLPPSPIEAKLADYADWQTELLAGLIAMGDPDSLLAAALILHASYSGDPVETKKIAALLARALALSPGDRMIAATALRVCRSMPGCNSNSYEQVVVDIDARNSLGLLPGTLYMIEFGTRQQVLEALEALAGTRLSLYNAEIVTRAATAIARTPTSPRFVPPNGDLLRLEGELTLRAVNAVEVPTYLALEAACQVRDSRNRKACSAIAKGLGQSDLIELQRVGMGLEASIAAGWKQKWSDAEEAAAYINWVQTMMAAKPPADQWIALLSQNRTELAASLAWLDRQGVAARRVPAWLRHTL